MDLPSVLWVELRAHAGRHLPPLLAPELLVQMRSVTSIAVARGVMAAQANQIQVIVAALDEGSLEVDVRALAEMAGAHARLIVVVPSSDEVVRALGAGADDACTHAAASVQLPPRIIAQARGRGAVATAIDPDQVRLLELRLAELSKDNERLRELAHRDELTGLGNRRRFLSHIDYMIEYASRFGGSLSILMIDLDGMKQLNDMHGHAAGDVALARVGEVIKSSIRGVDVAARLGGDEFSVIMPSTASLAAGRVAERIREAVAALALPNGARVSASFGIATLSGAPRGIGFAAEELIARADAALYAAKRAGKNRIEFDGQHVRAA